MADFDNTAPVLIGVGEASGSRLGIDWPSPTLLAGAAIKAALDDSGLDSGQAAALAAVIDCIAATRTFEDSGLSMGTGSPDNVPHAYAAAGGIAPTHFVYADVGGQSPQALVNEFAGAVQRGEYRAVVIAGAEAIGTTKRARKQGVELDWRQASDTALDSRVSNYPILSRAEIRHGIISMPLAYGWIETARRARLGFDFESYQSEMANLWAEMSEKSLGNEHAQFAKQRDAAVLAADTADNYRITEIYRRWMVAQDAVDLGGALILTTAGTAQDLGIKPDKLIWLMGAAEANEPPLSERANLSGCDAQEFAVTAALDQAGISAADLGPIDIYSCFPCAVFAGVDTMQLPERALRDYTLTGGLSFFGGPGNGYSLHAIAAMVRSLRADGRKPGLVTANGGVLTKQAVGVYSSVQPKSAWPGFAATGYQAEPIVLADTPSGKGKVLTYTRPVIKAVAGDAAVIVGMENGVRALAVLEAAAIPEGNDLLAQIVQITAGEKRHIAALV
jgi:acetyl-CoA C-acetyltransferase